MREERKTSGPIEASRYRFFCARLATCQVFLNERLEQRKFVKKVGSPTPEWIEKDIKNLFKLKRSLKGEKIKIEKTLGISK